MKIKLLLLSAIMTCIPVTSVYAQSVTIQYGTVVGVQTISKPCREICDSGRGARPPVRRPPSGPVDIVDHQGNYQNSLSPGTPQTIGGGPMFNTVKVRIIQ